MVVVVVVVEEGVVVVVEAFRLQAPPAWVVSAEDHQADWESLLQ